MSEPVVDWRRTTYVVRLLLLGILFLWGCTAKRTHALARIQASGTLRVALDPAFPPFEFVDGEGQVAGLDVDLARGIATRLGVDAHFVTTGYDALYDALTVDRADVIISALYPDPSRMQTFIFSPSYFNAGEVLVVPDGAAIDGIPDLAGRSVAVIFGTEAHVAALRWETTLDPPPVLLTGDTPEAVLALLTEGRVDAAIVDHVAAQARASGLRVVLPPIIDEPYVVAARKQDASLLNAISDILVEMQSVGELDALIQQWMQ